MIEVPPHTYLSCNFYYFVDGSHERPGQADACTRCEDTLRQCGATKLCCQKLWWCVVILRCSVARNLPVGQFHTSMRAGDMSLDSVLSTATLSALSSILKESKHGAEMLLAYNTLSMLKERAGAVKTMMALIIVLLSRWLVALPKSPPSNGTLTWYFLKERRSGNRLSSSVDWCTCRISCCEQSFRTWRWRYVTSNIVFIFMFISFFFAYLCTLTPGHMQFCDVGMQAVEWADEEWCSVEEPLQRSIQ